MSLLIILGAILIITIFTAVVYRKKQEEEMELSSVLKCVYSEWSNCDCNTRRKRRQVIEGDKTCNDTVRSCIPDPKICCKYSEYGDCDCDTKTQTRLLLSGDPEICVDTESSCEPSEENCCRYTQYGLCDCNTNTQIRELRQGDPEICNKDLIRSCDENEYNNYCCKYSDWSSCNCNTSRKIKTLIKGDANICQPIKKMDCEIGDYRTKCCKYGPLTPPDKCPCDRIKKRMLITGFQSKCDPFKTESCQNTQEEIIACNTPAPTPSSTPSPTPDTYKVEGVWNSFKKDFYEWGPVTLSYEGNNQSGNRIYNISGGRINDDRYRYLLMNPNTKIFYLPNAPPDGITLTSVITSRGKVIEINSDNVKIIRE